MRRTACLLLLAVPLMAASKSTRAQTTPSAAALTLARTLVEKSGVAGQMTMNGLIMPPPGFLASLGVTDPQQAQTVAHDAVLPTLGDNEEALTAIQVKSYAALLSVDEMKAAIAFFDSPAGKAFLKFRTAGAEAEMSKEAALIAKLQPEIAAQARVVSRAHGWPGG